MSALRRSEVFDLDEENSESENLAPGPRTPSFDDDDADAAGPSDQTGIDPFRRAMPQIEVEEDVCSICLDAFTDDDPGNATICGCTFCSSHRQDKLEINEERL